MKKWYKKWWAILLLILAFFTLILTFAGFFYLSAIINSNLASGRREQTDEIDKLIAGNPEDNYWLGAASPKVTIVEFADFACPHCKNMFSKIREIGITHKKNVKIVFRDYPVVSSASVSLALAARCAGEQGFFWVMHDKLFLNPGATQREDFLKLTNQIGLNTAKFTQCFDNKTYLPEIERDLRDGNALNIAGTPTLFINNERFSGDVPYGQLVTVIEQKLLE